MAKLQLALDNESLINSLKIAQEVNLEVDIIEVGTILAIENGMDAVRIMKSLFPNHIILADIRIIKAGGKLAKLAFDSGADWVTVMSNASMDTIEAVVKEVNSKKNKDVQIEINDSFTEKQLDEWKNLGINQLIYHRSSEVVVNEREWEDKEIENLKTLEEKGFKLNITGGLKVDDIKIFEELNINSFIVGRSITNSTEPLTSTKEYKKEIRRVFKNF